jgi:transcriptional regulator with XRE-family HTH domain
LSGPAQQAREALGTRLREIRSDAGLTARALASRAGWHFTKVSKVEHGTRAPSEADIKAWCQACRAEDEMQDLIATARAIESMYVEWRRHARAGLKHLQEASIPLYERTRLFRVYEPLVIPGLFTTAGYANALFDFWVSFMGLPGDADSAVAARMERQKVLYSGDRRFQFILEEQALRTRVGDLAVMAGQLDRLLAVMSVPRVNLGIIPATGKRDSWTEANFWIFDDSRVHVETASARLTITQRQEITLYTRLFERLQGSAVYGPSARALISRALNDLTVEAE